MTAASKAPRRASSWDIYLVDEWVERMDEMMAGLKADEKAAWLVG
jgi:hypothetical protein